MMQLPRVFGRYTLERRLGSGGMGDVYLASSEGAHGFGTRVAVKLMRPEIAKDREAIRMLIDEAKTTVQLQHPNIAQVFDLGVVDGQYYIALEYVDGIDLRTICEHASARAELLPVGAACFILTKICDGLDYAHNKRDHEGRELHIVHRDVTPHNILVSREGEVRVTDFGVARTAGASRKTRAGELVGKLAYMAPEQVRGLPLDRRADVFACGCILFELLTNVRAFQGADDLDTLERVRNVELLPPSTYNRRVPDELERIVLKALAKDVEDRYQNAIDMHDELQAFVYTAGEFFSRKDLAELMRQFLDNTGHAGAPETELDLEDLELLADEEETAAAHMEIMREPPRVIGLATRLARADLYVDGPESTVTHRTPHALEPESSVSGVVMMRLGDASPQDKDMAKAFQLLREGSRSAIEADRARRPEDIAKLRQFAALQFVQAVEVALYRRLSLAFPAAVRESWLAVRAASNVETKSSNERAMQLFLEKGSRPSMKLLGALLKPPGPKPAGLGDALRRACRIDDKHRKHLFELGAIRNVLAHLPEYEEDPELPIDAPPNLFREIRNEDGTRKLVIDSAYLVFLEQLCKELLSAEGLMSA